MISRQQLNDFYSALLQPERYSDYGPNGLQIEGKEAINKIAFAVSATRDSITRAVEQQADALVVHHGLFWSFHGAKTLTGPFAKRVVPLIKKDINLFAYHLPLDGHAEIGNAATLGRLIDCIEQQPFGDYKGMPTGIKGVLKTPVAAATLTEKLQKVLNHDVILASTDRYRTVKTLGIITGGANGEWKTAAEQGLDAYITGEISEHDWHDSQEHGIHMLAGGHNATEQFGIKAMMNKTQQQLNVDCFFIGSDNPA
ncbi:Nif3-like dinuclear metal center hexameric protein [Methylomarinum sp. Ch1-1]|uniref:GTP cyclohydrolase 1 type 2 homolog n=1 Tax=Methylomarinum roseum TaxID=3067653 RepID=A0AAU7NUP2_9GAMM|nr:Nif3-like dinuclear metal center hexameric protein [Methylomarinum sp. Ch1-1]MDP4519196.1 Nif3-like dinuclear metal center hexameric protein [Methylomarinum sp. Ch1-1]